MAIAFVLCLQFMFLGFIWGFATSEMIEFLIPFKLQGKKIGSAKI